MAEYCLIIDNRETKLIALLANKQVENFNIIVKPLKLGDIVIARSSKDKLDDEEWIYSNTITIFERKTCSDLLSSINDGRYREQKARLLSNFSKNQVCYIIENNIDKSLDKYRKGGCKVVRGAIINKIFRDRLTVVKTQNLEETVEYLLTICKKVNSNIEFFLQESKESTSSSSANTTNTINYSSVVKINKRENITFDNFGIISLGIIPGVSNKIAKRILEEYDCINNLISSINKCFTEQGDYVRIITAISDLSIEITGGKQRRIGKQVAQRIVEMLINK